MKLLLLIGCFALVLAAPAFLRSQETTNPSLPSVENGQKKKKTELEEKMDKIVKPYRELKKQVADPTKNESSLHLLAVMRKGAKESAGLTPAKVADIPEDRRAKFVADYNAGIKSLLPYFDKLEAALKAGENDKAVLIVNEIEEYAKKSHKEFRRPMKGPPPVAGS